MIESLILGLAHASGKLVKSSGFTLKDFLGQTPAAIKSVADSSSILREVLAANDDGKDPLTGVWRVHKWENKKPTSVFGMTIEGDLAIYYREPGRRIWHGIMNHQVYYAPSAETVPGNDDPFNAIYRVHLEMDSAGNVTGKTHMLAKQYRSRRRQLKYSLSKRWGLREKRDGDFVSGSVNPSKTVFAGVFQTVGGTARSFEFSDHLGWARAQNLLSGG